MGRAASFSVALVATLVACTGPPQPPSGSAPPPPAVLQQLPIKVRELAAGDGSVWVATRDAVLEVDPMAGHALGAPVPLGKAVGIDVSRNILWVLQDHPVKPRFGHLTKVNTSTHEILATVRVSREPQNLAVGMGHVWIPDEHDFVDVLAVRTLERVGRIAIEDGPRSIAIGGGAVWVGTAFNTPTVFRIDPESRRVVATLPDYELMTVGGGYVWAWTQEGNVMRRIDPRTDQLVPGDLPLSEAFPVSFGDGGGFAQLSLPISGCTAEGRFFVDPCSYRAIARLDPAGLTRVSDPVPFPANEGPTIVAYGAVWGTSIYDDLLRLPVSAIR